MSLSALPPYARAGAALAGAFLVAILAQYLGRVRAAGSVSDVCQAAVSERWPGSDPLRFEVAEVAARPVGVGQRYVSQFQTEDEASISPARPSRPTTGGWNASCLRPSADNPPCPTTARAGSWPDGRPARLVRLRRLRGAGDGDVLVGGATPIGLPEGWPIYVDEPIRALSSVILAGGNRSTKIELDPRDLERIPGLNTVAALTLPR